jgi:hypothetical protein
MARVRVRAALVCLGLVGAALGAGVAHPQPARAVTPGPLPDLTITHRLSNGGMNLYRMSLSDLMSDYGHVQLVRTLSTGGYTFDRSKTVGGDFADVTAHDDGSADHVIWQGLADGSIKVFGVGGGTDTAPRLWLTLPHSAGWNWADTRLVVGDVDGDTWDDLVVRHRTKTGEKDWVLFSNGTKLTAPVVWNLPTSGFTSSREYLGDLDGDYAANLLTVTSVSGGSELDMKGFSAFGSTNGGAVGFQGASTDGWTLAGTRQVVGDVTGDGLDDVVSIKSETNGLSVWVHANCEPGGNTALPDCFDAPVQWQSLTTGGWSYANSTQFLAWSNNDPYMDLITVHKSSSGGLLIWRALSDGTSFGTPELIADLRTGGWNYAKARESVANTWGVM